MVQVAVVRPAVSYRVSVVRVMVPEVSTVVIGCSHALYLVTRLSGSVVAPPAPTDGAAAGRVRQASPAHSTLSPHAASAVFVPAV